MRLAQRPVTIRLGLALAAVVAVLTGLLFAPAAAYADTTVLQCLGTQSASINPGLTMTPRQVHTNISVSYSCPANSVSVVGSSSFDSTGSCVINASFQPDVFTYTFTPGGSSTVTYSTTSVVQLLDGTTNVTSVGMVTNGAYLGASVVREVIYPAPLGLLQCLSNQGITSLVGQSTLTLTTI